MFSRAFGNTYRYEMYDYSLITARMIISDTEKNHFLKRTSTQSEQKCAATCFRKNRPVNKKENGETVSNIRLLLAKSIPY